MNIMGIGNAIALCRWLYETEAFDRAAIRLGRYVPEVAIVVGASGAGKTSVVNALRGLEPESTQPTREPLHHQLTLRVSHQSQDYRIFYEVIDCPRGYEEQVIDNIIGDGRNFGIINVVADGYLEAPSLKAPILKKWHSKDGDIEFLQERREQELQAVAAWADAILRWSEGADWIITLVNKADLWCQNTEAEVPERYLGRSFQHTEMLAHQAVLRLSTQTAPFYNLIPATGWYSTARRLGDWDALIRHLAVYPLDRRRMLPL